MALRAARMGGMRASLDGELDGLTERIIGAGFAVSLGLGQAVPRLSIEAYLSSRRCASRAWLFRRKGRRVIG